MTSKSLNFPAWTPDVPLTTGDFSNVKALANGYGPVRDFSPVTAALSGVTGGAGFIGQDGSSSLIAGNATALYRYSGTTWSSLLAAAATSPWRFAQFGNNVIAVNGGAPVRYDLAAGTAVALGGSPPSSDLVATVRQQVFLAGDSGDQITLSISGYNDSEGWTAGDNQCLYVPFPSGGAIMGLAGGETGIILQQRSIKRATYTGDTTVWQFDEISNEIGCMAKGSVAQAGQLVFFLSEQGFQVCDRSETTHIGMDMVDEFFFASYSRRDIIDSLRCAIDPRSTTVTWSMPGSPGRLWAFNWVRKTWSVEDINLKSVFTGFSSDVSLEDIDTLYPGGIDTVPISLDSTMFAGGQPLFFLVNNSDVIGTLTGETMAMTINIPPAEVEQGRRIRITGIYLESDATSAVVKVDARVRAGDTANIKTSSAMRESGRLPVRANGRYNGFQVSIPAGHNWTYCNGIRLDYELEGIR